MVVNLALLPFIEDFEVCCQYSWGSAVLAYLYRGLCKGADHHTSVVGGCMLLLQLWAWERLPMLRPEGVIAELNIRDLPVGARWVGAHFWGNVPHHVIRAYRNQLDRVNQQMFVFEPYNALFPQLPDYCTADQAIWTARVPLIYFYIIEHYYPDRFCRQFSRFPRCPV
ncbi:serine/threonine-protein phosphatase 7 long form homolog [Ipomoea triloba]|uniref:serine/threonine-protein phosphatase 7 long form homolog n=1 Tax=Ipomoea triloba TaxID=35885 RepID=UPI00125CE6B8|nr:serine/threonine-protein phosphatase 7 long form homolog [Ipomoea triloba]